MLGDTPEFALSALALIPLAWLIGEATEHAAEHTGPGIGGFLNASFGNAPELIIALFAINEGLPEVVRGSLTGSVVGNLLLVLGFSLARRAERRADRPRVELHLARARRARRLPVPHPAVPAGRATATGTRSQVTSIPSSRSSCSSSTSIATWRSLKRHQRRCT